MDELLSPHEKRTRDAVRSFARARLACRGHGRDAAGGAAFERRIRAAAAAGYCGLGAPPSLGGVKRTAAEIAVTLEEIGAAAPLLGLGLAGHNFLCLGHVLRQGTPAQRDEAGRRLASGRAWGTCFGPADPDGGGSGGEAPSARREGNGWWIRNLRCRAREFPAETMIVFAETGANAAPGGLTAFLWNRRKIPQPDRRTGLLRLPAESRLGGEGTALETARVLGERADLFYAAAFVGAASNVHRRCLALARKRGLFASTLFEPAVILAGLADAYVDLEAARLMIRRAAWLADKSRLEPGEPAVMKATARAVALELLDRGLRLDTDAAELAELRARISGTCPGALDGTPAAGVRRACRIRS